MDWLFDFRYGQARRRLLGVAVLFLITIGGLIYFLNRKVEPAQTTPPKPSFVAQPNMRSMETDAAPQKVDSSPATTLEQDVERVIEAQSNQEQHARDALDKSLGLIQQHDGKGALAAAQKVREISKSEAILAKAWNVEGVSYTLLGRFPEAEAALEKALSMEPQNAFFLFNQVIVKQHLGKFAEALRLLKILDAEKFETGLIDTKILLVRIQNGEGEAVRRQMDVTMTVSPMTADEKGLIVRAALAMKAGDDIAAASLLLRAREKMGASVFAAFMQDPFFIPYHTHPLLTRFFLSYAS